MYRSISENFLKNVNAIKNTNFTVLLVCHDAIFFENQLLFG